MGAVKNAMHDELEQRRAEEAGEAQFGREEMIDAIASAITDSMGPDWNSHTGAKAVVENCGVFELYAALAKAEVHVASVVDEVSEGDLPDWVSDLAEIRAALAKARGEQ